MKAVPQTLESRALKAALAILPLLLLVSTAGVFLLGARWWGADGGYAAGFLFYWLFWCLLVPFALLGKDGMAGLFKERRPLMQRKHWYLILMLALTGLGALVMYFLPALPKFPLLLFLAGAPIAAVNGICEEILWRGVYVRIFPSNWFWGLLFPSLGFALWHIAPQLIYPAEGGIFSLVISAFFLGLCYALAAYRTGSMKWAGISHSINGILAFGGAIAPALLRLLGIL